MSLSKNSEVIKMIIRNENFEDVRIIHEINIEAFENDSEAKLVDRLRESQIEIISLVAEVNKKLVGHIFFSPLTIDKHNLRIAGLAPIAVLPDYQNKRIGDWFIS